MRRPFFPPRNSSELVLHLGIRSSSAEIVHLAPDNKGAITGGVVAGIVLA